MNRNELRLKFYFLFFIIFYPIYHYSLIINKIPLSGRQFRITLRFLSKSILSICLSTFIIKKSTALKRMCMVPQGEVSHLTSPKNVQICNKTSSLKQRHKLDIDPLVVGRAVLSYLWYNQITRLSGIL